MTIQELREKNIEFLEQEKERIQIRLRSLRAQLAAHQLTNIREIRKMRKLIAQLKTIQKEKQAV